MTKINDGGWAFPVGFSTAEADECGMSLRDWFAGQAMTGTVNYPNAPDFKTAAKLAYQMADAMLAAREAKS